MGNKQTYILAVNAGSSSVKLAIWKLDSGLKKVADGSIEKIGQPKPEICLSTEENRVSVVEVSNHSEASELLLDKLKNVMSDDAPSVCVHRVVNGGDSFRQITKIDNDVVAKLKDLGKFSPLHTKTELELISAFTAMYPEALQLACFDSSFHTTMPMRARLLPVPRKYYEKGVKSYGFHGLAYQQITDELRQYFDENLPDKIVSAHLGNGASLVAIENGKSIDTTMTFSPNSGIPMSSRSGSIDPEIVYYLQQYEGLSADQISALLNEESGLLGMSSLSSDMKVLLENEDNNQDAKDAAEVFCYQVKKGVGAYAAAMGGLDVLTFSGGMGENAPKIRARVCEGLEFLGIDIDESANEAGEEVISKESSKVKVMIIHTDESATMAKQAAEYLNGGEYEAKD